jgi:hypothetical protein
MDVNDDSKMDLVVAGEWMPVSVYINAGAKLENRTLEYFDKAYSGWWNEIDTADVNNDGETDLICGNTGSNMQCKVSDDQPAELVYDDFDSNGSVDPLFCFYIQGKSYPYVTRDELLEQLSALRSRFRDYKSYADAAVTDILNEQQLKTANRLMANHPETTLFIRNRKGKFQPAPLPKQAQYAPVHTIMVNDFDNDGMKDILLCGNNSFNKIKIGKSDANYGMLLKGDGKGGFQYVTQPLSGFDLRGDVRSAIQIDNNLWFGMTQQPISAYRFNQEKKTGAAHR